MLLIINLVIALPICCVYNMPKPGFKSITVSENVYKKFYKVYEKSKRTRTQRHNKLLWLSYKYDGGDDGKV